MPAARKGNTNRQLRAARKAKKDEFYTSRQVIEAELQWYRKDFIGRPVLCNCNDWPKDGFPRSEFVRFFMKKMASWNIPKLIAVGYQDSVGTLFEEGHGTLYVLENDGRPADQPYTEDDFKVTELEGSGGFQTPECERLLDIPGVIVCTNPPFSGFRVFMGVLQAHHVGFLVLGNINAVAYKEIFPLFLNNQCWLGVSIHSGDRPFYVPDDYPLEAAGSGYDEDGHPYIRVKGVRWFTNLSGGRVGKNELSLEGNYYTGHESEFPKYDDYDAINVNRVADIPIDYFGEMGVPITFLDKWAPQVDDTERERERERTGSLQSARTRRQLFAGRIQSGGIRAHSGSEEVQASHHPTFRLVGKLQNGTDVPWDKSKPIVMGQEKYVRFLIQRSDCLASPTAPGGSAGSV